MNIYKNPVWLKYRCDNGAQWTAVKDGICADADNSPCTFSGCPEGHKVHIIGETPNRHDASNWFKRP